MPQLSELVHNFSITKFALDIKSRYLLRIFKTTELRDITRKIISYFAIIIQKSRCTMLCLYISSVL